MLYPHYPVPGSWYLPMFPHTLICTIPCPPLLSVLARDPQSVVFYDSKGQFVGVRRPGSGNPIEVEGIRLVVDR